MAVYLHAEIHVRPGHLADMLNLLEHTIVPQMEGEGWKLLGCHTGISGPRNTIIDLWELDDLEHFRRAHAAILGKLPPDNDLRAKLDAWVESETLTFLDKRF
ncbi:MAG: NIPSNAP family protein [Sphingomonadales bacterium]|nr:NIPSNAP family protein [Sphingomonadales bacterium]